MSFDVGDIPASKEMSPRLNGRLLDLLSSGRNIDIIYLARLNEHTSVRMYPIAAVAVAAVAFQAGAAVHAGRCREGGHYRAGR